MASHVQLLDIMGQLQNLEISLVNLFIESALRLAGVINAKFFIIVETESYGRRVAGCDQLCADFVSGRLKATPGDVRTQLVDADVIPVAEYPLTAPAILGGIVHGVATPLPPPPTTGFGSKTRKRTAPTDDNFLITNASPLTASSSKRPKIEPEEEASISNVKTETPEEGVDVIELLEGSDGIQNVTVLDDDDDDDILFDFEGSDAESFQLPAGQQDASPSNSNKDLQDISCLHDFANSNAKALALRQRLSDDMDFNRGSTDMRLFSSVMYDVGKIIAGWVTIPNKSHPINKDIFSKSFAYFWKSIPEFERWTTQIIFPDSQHHNFKPYTRAICYHGFRKYVNKMKN